MSSLTVLCITKDPGAQVAAVLAPLRPVADEIVIVADSRVADAELSVYAAACDRLVLHAFVLPVERQFAWAHAQCRSDWILRIDGDEVLSPALTARLPELTRRRDRMQYWLPRRWSFPGPRHWLGERPWHPDYQLRLVRNDPATLAFPGVIHSSALPSEPFELLEEPMYHLNLLLQSRQERETKIAEYASIGHPGSVAPGGGPQNLYYLPEQWALGSPATTPAFDAECIQMVLNLPRAPAVPVNRNTLLTAGRADIDAQWDARTLRPEDYRATIRPLEEHPRLAPAAPDRLIVRITNHGTTGWPGGLVREPAIRLGYRWLTLDGSVVVVHARRSGLPCPLTPGESTIAWLSVLAPEQPGDYILEIDLVHENVRWFDACARVPVHVAMRSSKLDGVVQPASRLG